jgi:NADH dehydrogenase
MLHRTRFIMGRVNGIEPRRKTVTAATLAGELTLPFEHLVLAFGNRARLDLIPGLAENALPLKTIGDAMHIRNMVLRRVAQIELEADPAVRRRLGHFVVIGGGFSGVETAGQLADCLEGILRYYPRVEKDELKVTLLQDRPRLLLELSERLGVAAHRSLAARGVDVRTSTRATCVGPRTVALAGGEILHAATTICTIGTRPNALVARMTIPVERGRIVVNPDLSVRDTPGLWAIGDCALVTNARDGKLAPPTAQFAIREARQLAANLVAVLEGAPTRAFDYKARGSMAAIGHLNGVADVFGIPLWGLPAWLLWRAYYLSQMPTLGRKLRIFVEWTWGMFFPADITHLRFTRSHEVDDGSAARGAQAAAARPAALKVA